ncbi:MAG TPA: tetratricopeptide repeat protein [Verrucomicrobiae bacterium]|nr:tetratricopeptide repeat protein [Verrucomicrobiae bacterium]
MLTTKKAVAKRVLILLLTAAVFAGCTPPGPRAFLQGKKLLEDGRYLEAIDKLKTATSLLASNAQAWNYLGLACQYANQPTNAAPAYTRALKLDPDLVEAHYNLGCLWIDQKKFDSAKAELITYTSLRKNSVPGWLKLASAQLRSVRSAPPSARAADLAAVQKSYDEALRLGPLNPEALNGLGLIQFEHNRPHEAAQYFNRALKQQPVYGPAMLNLAVVSHWYLNDRPLALKKYREYLALPDAAPNQADVQAAVRDLEQQLNPPTIHPPVPTPTVAISTASVTNVPKLQPRPLTHPAAPAVATIPTNTPRTTREPVEETKLEAVKLPSEPVLKSPEPAVASTGAPPPVQVKSSVPKTASAPKPEKPGFMARINPFHSQPKSNSQSAVASANPGPSLTGFSGPRYHYRSPSKPVKGDEAAAQRVFAQGLQAQQANHLPEAIQGYRQATQLDPADYDAYYNMGLAATATGNLAQALMAYEFALAIRPESPDARYNFALLLKRSNYIVDAVNEFRKIVSRYPSEPRAHLALGNIYAQIVHNPARARECYLKVIELDPHNAQSEAIREWMIQNPP